MAAELAWSYARLGRLRGRYAWATSFGLLDYRVSRSWDESKKYIQDLIQLARLTNSSVVDIALDVNVKYKQEEGDILDDPTLYHKLVGSFIYN
ncbi:hypothetical protein CR513_07390, partial [Mucuna pruriens]